jgi:hypothetical protein
MKIIFKRATIACLIYAGCLVASAADITVEANYPGGNISIVKIEDNTVTVAPDLRDIQKGQWWFYWSFRLRAPEQKPVTIVFREKNPIGVRGPAMSVDGGRTWKWLGKESVKALKLGEKPAWTFEAVVPAGCPDVRYAYCPPYLESHLQAWLDTNHANPALRVEELCKSRKGRSVQMLRAGCLESGKSQGVVLLTSRHHCCETMATYAMEGLLTAALAEDETGRRWRKNWEIIAIPFMDKDGVEDGDQGKNRNPHDHNRDYNATPLYPEVNALMKLGTSLQSRIVISLDMHCPYISGEWNDRAYFVGPPEPDFFEKEKAYAQVLERVQQGSIHFRSADCLAYGTAWNKGSNFNQGRSCSTWARETFPTAKLAATIEIAYADALGKEVNADSARALGRDLSQAMIEFLGK